MRRCQALRCGLFCPVWCWPRTSMSNLHELRTRCPLTSCAKGSCGLQDQYNDQDRRQCLIAQEDDGSESASTKAPLDDVVPGVQTNGFIGKIRLPVFSGHSVHIDTPPRIIGISVKKPSRPVDHQRKFRIVEMESFDFALLLPQTRCRRRPPVGPVKRQPLSLWPL